MGPANTLSRKDKVDTDNNNQEVMVLKQVDQDFHIWALDVTLAQKITQSMSSNPIVTKVLMAMNDEEGGPWIPWMAKEDWTFKGGQL